MLHHDIFHTTKRFDVVQLSLFSGRFHAALYYEAVTFCNILNVNGLRNGRLPICKTIVRFRKTKAKKIIKKTPRKCLRLGVFSIFAHKWPLHNIKLPLSSNIFPCVSYFVILPISFLLAFVTVELSMADR